MIKTLRVTSAAAVLLAVVVLASVLGFQRYASLLPLNLGVRSDKQTEKILSGPSAVDRFKEQYGNKVPPGRDTTPPLVKQAEIFRDIINPPAPDGTRPAMALKNLPPKPIATTAKPIGPVSSKFDLLQTCCSSDPKTSFANIRLADGTYQWVGVGSEIGRVTIKEIHKGSILCSDGNRDFPMDMEAPPETSSLLETGKVPKDVASLKSQASTEAPASGRGPNVKPQTATAASPVKPVVGSSRAAALGTPSAQISKEEQDNLSQLGNKLKAGAGTDANNAAANKLISDYKSSLGNPPLPGVVPNPTSDPADANKGAWKDRMKEDSLRQWQKRLAAPRTPKK
jgi:hypothetical protein